MFSYHKTIQSTKAEGIIILLTSCKFSGLCPTNRLFTPLSRCSHVDYLFIFYLFCFFPFSNFSHFYYPPFLFQTLVYQKKSPKTRKNAHFVRKPKARSTVQTVQLKHAHQSNIPSHIVRTFRNPNPHINPTSQPAPTATPTGPNRTTRPVHRTNPQNKKGRGLRGSEALA